MEFQRFERGRQHKPFIRIPSDHPLRRVRMANRMSQRELSRRTGVSRTTIKNIEQHYLAPMPETIRKLAHALGVEPRELIRQ